MRIDALVLFEAPDQYEDAVKRSFKKAAQYQEGRKVRGGRQARAMGKRSSYGRQLEEEIWQNAVSNTM